MADRDETSELAKSCPLLRGDAGRKKMKRKEEKKIKRGAGGLGPYHQFATIAKQAL